MKKLLGNFEGIFKCPARIKVAEELWPFFDRDVQFREFRFFLSPRFLLLTNLHDRIPTHIVNEILAIFRQRISRSTTLFRRPAHMIFHEEKHGLEHPGFRWNSLSITHDQGIIER